MTNKISKYLNELKTQTGLTHQQLADMTGVPYGTIPKYFSPGMDDDAANFEIVRKLVTAMHGSLDTLAGIEPPLPVVDEAPEQSPTVHEHRFSFMPIKAEIREMMTDAIAQVYSSEAYKSLHNNLKWWRGLALVETAFIVGVLIFDITHPTMGYIQYAAALISNLQGMSGQWHRIV